ncbi:MAG: Flp family type IVb pilin [Enhydrobacter sp.]|nr:MAG: Flp family type IVb pilin [Enhydrobacter sp.]
MLLTLRKLLADCKAATAIEYTLIVFLIASAAIGGMSLVGQNVLNMLGPAANAMT